MSAVLKTTFTICDSKKFHDRLEPTGLTAKQADGIYELAAKYIPFHILENIYAKQRYYDDSDNVNQTNQHVDMMRKMLESKGFTAEQADGLVEMVTEYVCPQILANIYTQQRHNDNNADQINQIH